MLEGLWWIDTGFWWDHSTTSPRCRVVADLKVFLSTVHNKKNNTADHDMLIFVQSNLVTIYLEGHKGSVRSKGSWLYPFLIKWV